jgi:hypothetical protein
MIRVIAWATRCRCPLAQGEMPTVRKNTDIIRCAGLVVMAWIATGCCSYTPDHYHASIIRGFGYTDLIRSAGGIVVTCSAIFGGSLADHVITSMRYDTGVRICALIGVIAGATRESSSKAGRRTIKLGLLTHIISGTLRIVNAWKASNKLTAASKTC